LSEQDDRPLPVGLAETLAMFRPGVKLRNDAVRGRLGISAAAANYRLNRLERLGWLESERDGRQRVYWRVGDV